MTGNGLRDLREKIVREHMATEDAHRFEHTLDTFTHPRYEIVPTQEVFDGVDQLRTFYAEMHRAFPDFHFEDTSLRHLDDAVLVETDFVGTHLGRWRGLPATGRGVRYRMCNVFEFDGEGLVCERLYFDLMTVLQQVGIARDPTTVAGRFSAFINHPVTVTRAFARAAWRRS